MIDQIFQYSFVVHGLEAGLIVGIIAPLIGIFLVLRRYSLVADTLSHVSLGGIAVGGLMGWNPILTAFGATLLSSLGIERLRTSQKIYGESALAIFLSASLAIAIVILSVAHGFNATLFNYLFGSIVTVTARNVLEIGVLAAVVLVVLVLFYKELIYITFDEEAAKVSGIPVQRINILLMLLSAMTVSLSIPIVGVLLIGALIVLPAVTALQLKQGLGKTIVFAEIISLFSVLSGIIASFYLNLATGGTIVLVMIIIFIFVLIQKNL